MYYTKYAMGIFILLASLAVFNPAEAMPAPDAHYLNNANVSLTTNQPQQSQPNNHTASDLINSAFAWLRNVIMIVYNAIITGIMNLYQFAQDEWHKIFGK